MECKKSKESVKEVAGAIIGGGKAKQHSHKGIKWSIPFILGNEKSLLKNSTIVDKKQRGYLSEAAKNSRLSESPLILKGSVDGFTKDAFDTLCAGKGPLLIIIRSDNGSVFGGCSSLPWP